MYAGDLVVGRHDPTEERAAPRLPTPVTFPNLVFLQQLEPSAWSQRHKPDLYTLRLKWQYSPHGNNTLGLDVFKSTNVQFKPACDLDEFFESAASDTPCLPPTSWLAEEPTSEQRKETLYPGPPSVPNASGVTPPRKLPNGRPWPTRGDFWDRVAQLKYANEEGFRAYARITKDGVPPQRLTHARPFYEQLDTLVQYWDTSLDEYMSTQAIPEAIQDTSSHTPPQDYDAPRKRTKLSPETIVGPSSASETATLADLTNQPGNKSRPVRPAGRRAGFRVPAPAAPPAGTYRGWRIDTGSRMPNASRDMVVKALMEVAIWPFGFHIDGVEALERVSPRLELGKLRIAVPLTRRVWRPPSDRLEARSLLVYGPVLGTSCRPVTAFNERKVTGEVDLLRELGALLLLAQERSRQGREERKPGEGTWWYEKPRWGGLPYEVPGEYVFPKETEEVANDGKDTKAKGNDGKDKRQLGYTARKERERARKREQLPSDMTIRQRAIHSYKKFDPASSTWDAKARYVPVGKRKDSEWDDVFLISSLNHHVSILKLRVHNAYLHFLETNKLPPSTTPVDWSSPVLSRTRWFDLIVPAERAELLRGLWAVSTYLVRPGAMV